MRGNVGVYLTITVSVHILILEMFLIILFHIINYEVYSELCKIIYKFCINMLIRILQQWDFKLLSRCIQVIAEGI
jgi:hypothetical protein